MEVNEDDFYIILPSNANPDTHPDNTPNKYIVSWENPISIQDSQQWRVALTEMTFNFSPKTVTESSGIEYVTREGDVWKQTVQLKSEPNQDPYIVFTKFSEGEYQYLENSVPQVKLIKHNFLEFTSNFPFSIKFFKPMDSIQCGFSTNYNESTTDSKPYKLVSQKPVRELEYVLKDGKYVLPDNLKGINVSIELTQISIPFQKISKTFFPEATRWDTVVELLQGMQKQFSHIFDEIKLHDGKIMLVKKKEVQSIQFLNGFNFVLGFTQTHLTNKTEIANMPPQLNRGINNMYVYASICSPIQVGHVRVPLLKSIFVDLNKNMIQDELRNIDIRYPMYIPINSSTINSIEINIRSDSGSLVPFSKGAVTSITLHFKRVKKL